MLKVWLWKVLRWRKGLRLVQGERHSHHNTARPARSGYRRRRRLPLAQRRTGRRTYGPTGFRGYTMDKLPWPALIIRRG